MTQQLFNQLLFLIVHANNVVHEREIFLAKNLSSLHGFESTSLLDEFHALEKADRYQLLENSVVELKKLPKEEQVNAIAVLCIVGNADGCMDKEEWQLIHSIYHSELRLKLDDVLKSQRAYVTEMKAKQLYLKA